MRIRSLRVRTTFVMAAAVLVGLLATATLLIQGDWVEERREIETRATDFAILTTQSIAIAYETYYESGYFKFRELIRGMLERSPDVESVRFVDVSGRILFESGSLDDPVGAGESPKPVLRDPSLLEAVAGLQPVTLPRREGGFDVVSPHIEDWGRHRHSVIYSFNYDALIPRVLAQAYVTGGLAFGVLLVTSLLGLAWMARITRPLEQLSARVRQVAEGRFDRPLDIRTGDELQQLAEAFNRMARELEESMRRLEGSNAQLEARNAELERFTYTVSHDLKSPLITIRGFLGFLEGHASRGDLPALRRDLTRISDATLRMYRLLDELLSLSRVGRVVNVPEQVPLREVVDEAVRQTRGRLDARGVSVEVDADLPVVRVDRPRIVEVLQNLLDNAAKFSRGSDARVRVGSRSDASERVFFVQDDGIGIEPRYHDRVFKLFDKLDPASEGTGVGLALVKRIIEVHGGRVWVESQGGGSGTAVCFTLGVVEESPESQPARLNAPGAPPRDG